MKRLYRRGGLLGTLFFWGVVIGLGYGIYTLLQSPIFEKNPPEVLLVKERWWNPARPFEIHLKDESGIKKVTAYLTDGTHTRKIIDKSYTRPPRDLDLNITFPKIGLSTKNHLLKLTVKATDASRWHWLMGNETRAQSILHIDEVKPDLFAMITSYGITKGGSALAIFKAEDPNLKEVVVKTSFGKDFKPVPFYKKGYYAVLVAWPLTEKRFRAWIEAEDRAGNRSKTKLSFFLKNRTYRTSYLEAKEKFINGKIADLAEDHPEKTKNMSPLEKFKFVNETYRGENDALIAKITSRIDGNLLTSFDITPFYPLKNGKVVGSFGDHRFYYYKEKENIISEAYHLGIDFASVRQDTLRASNPGVVVFANYNGIYGNCLIIYHGLGLYSLYAHCSSLLVQKGDIVKRGDIIAKTGATGLALGDHLHFSLLVQGIFVRPAEWMDTQWIKVNIKDVIDNAIKMINK
ncbi:MAG: hypothetical protein B6D59_02295 [Campylobacteraceae bacterium 4484_4]|nr:MAG: hypothetical protein B6D59_02295 [Campylobacteraceae bacterium 4484_4]